MAETFRIVSPVDGSVYAERPLSGPAEAIAAVEKAARAWESWRRTPLEERIRILDAAVERFTSRRSEIGTELTWQMGRPVTHAVREVGGFEERARTMLQLAPRALADIDPGEKPGFRRFIRREPVGVVLTIAPWNYPYLTAVNSIWPALAAGNTVILKPARQTALSGERIAQALAEAGLPEGVFQCVHMSHEAAAAAMRHEAVRLICFTGSVEGGRAVQRIVGDSRGFPAINLELGGKDPAYVRADADIAQAAAGIADGAFYNAGQSCCAIERAYVHRAIYDDFVDALVAHVRALRLGNPLERETTLGPMVDSASADKVRSQVEEALRAGARALIDARSFAADTGKGPYLAPQVLVEVDHRLRVMTEESFGPVLGLMKVQDDEEAIRLMNDSEYGLSASIWTRDVEAAERIGSRLETGTVFANLSDYLDPALAWTGVRHSGRGCTLSVVGYEYVTRPKSFNLKLAPVA